MLESTANEVSVLRERAVRFGAGVPRGIRSDRFGAMASVGCTAVLCRPS
jgi:hypothetical protein